MAAEHPFFGLLAMPASLGRLPTLYFFVPIERTKTTRPFTTSGVNVLKGGFLPFPPEMIAPKSESFIFCTSSE